MSLDASFLVCLVAPTLVACKTHGVPEPPPERDPTRAEAPVLPYEAPPDLLRSEVYRAGPEPDAGGGHQHHGGHGGGQPAKPAAEPEPAAPSGHEGHAPKSAPKGGAS